ncbi:uncharacterized protein LOC103316538 isoform X1 [Nasonia vitripennis]|uniref:Uncharacterized protein n=1 Tax=Nasonia vitripennis TaxID=7425 RepID=A0A7M7QLK8_NASVI|nr:uncharacterized protein LOC103316538 isoform X1 [Nasonia vitripennis]
MGYEQITVWPYYEAIKFLRNKLQEKDISLTSTSGCSKRQPQLDKFAVEKMEAKKNLTDVVKSLKETITKEATNILQQPASSSSEDYHLLLSDALQDVPSNQTLKCFQTIMRYIEEKKKSAFKKC